MNHVLMAIALIAASGVSAADEICDLLRQKENGTFTLTHKEGHLCIHHTGNVAVTDVRNRLLAKQLITMGNVLESQRELAKAVTALTAATDKLGTASEDLKKSSVTWRQNVFDTTLAEINRIPAAIAAKKP